MHPDQKKTQRLKKELADREKEFYDCFNFPPRLLEDPEYQMEVLVTLKILADKAQERAQERLDSERKESECIPYKVALNEYCRAVQLAQSFNENFSTLSLHWNKLGEFIDQMRHKHTSFKQHKERTTTVM
ncbi:MAG: hypothetical protein AB197_00220 [Parcubacteria bacterium C7867-002]|nr:MAG: hypothetical protein AB197_00220 [Parcubacteria bacterium C7867-002]